MVFSFLKNKLKEAISSLKVKREEKKVNAAAKGKAKISLKEKIIKKVTEKELTKEDFAKFFEALEINLMQSNVAFDTIQAIKGSLEGDLLGESLKRGSQADIINEALKKALSNVLKESSSEELLLAIKASVNPVTFMFVGTNGSGKTTTIGKFAYWLQKHKIPVVFAAGDTFRAASIEQLEKHGAALGIKVIKHTYGADSTAVVYDAIAHAKAKGVKAVLIDTAGRSHSNVNLMNELEKMKRVIKPDYIVFVGDALTGNDVIEQCRDFNQVTPFNFAVLTKTDVDEKGGAILSVSHSTGVPIMFLGTGQTYDDLKPFKKEELIKQILG